MFSRSIGTLFYVYTRGSVDGEIWVQSQEGNLSDNNTVNYGVIGFPSPRNLTEGEILDVAPTSDSFYEINSTKNVSVLVGDDTLWSGNNDASYFLPSVDGDFLGEKFYTIATVTQSS